FAGSNVSYYTGARNSSQTELNTRRIEGMHEREENGEKAYGRWAGRKTGQCLAVGDDGNRLACSDESLGEIARWPRNAFGGYGSGDGGASAFEQLRCDRLRGLHRFSQPCEFGRNRDPEITGQSCFSNFA